MSSSDGDVTHESYPTNISWKKENKRIKRYKEDTLSLLD